MAPLLGGTPTNTLLGAAAASVVGAVIAALGYVAKLGADTLREFLHVRRQRISRLVELHGLLSATRIAFLVQRAWVEKLLIDVRARGYTPVGATLDAQIADCYAAKLQPEEAKAHAYIRSITETTIRNTNLVLLEWLRGETYFRVPGSRNRDRAALASQLQHLHIHLLLWLAKFDTWIPNHPERALVFLADEQQYGPGFPSGIDQTVERLLNGGRSLLKRFR